MGRGAFYFKMTREEKAQFCIDNPKESPAFQFYPKDWFGSRHVSAMNSSQRGIHAAFIFAAWLEPVCGFPKGEEWLTARVPETEKTNCFSVLSWCWFLYCDFWFNERLLDERIKQIKLSLLRIDVGKCGGRPKKSKIYNSKPKANQKDSKAKANETKSEDEKEDEKEKEKENRNEEENRNENKIVEIPNHLKEIWPEFLKMRKLIKKPATDSAQKSLISKLQKLSPDLNIQIEIVQQSIDSSWQGFFPLKERYIIKPKPKNNRPELTIIQMRVMKVLGDEYQYPDNQDREAWELLYDTHCG